MYKAREFARLAGTTVRTLHHYDRLGLLKPRRTQSGYRLYRDDDLVRVEQIAALKFIGMPLRQIGELLERESAALHEVLGRQRRMLEEKRRLLDRTIEAVIEAERNPGLSSLRKIIEAIEMETNRDWMAKYSTPEAREKIEARRPLWSPELQERVSRQWGELIADVEAALGEDPVGPRGQALAARWNGLVEEFTGGDKDIADSVRNTWADRANWPAHMDTKAPVIKPEVWAYIARANS